MEFRSVQYRTAADGTIVWMDSAFADFARENGAPDLAGAALGTPIGRHLAGPEVQALYAAVMERVRTRPGGVEFPFRCDAPDLRRFMRMRVEPTGDGGLLFTSWLERSEPREPPVPEALLAGPHQNAPAEGVIVLCAWCKRVDLHGSGWADVEDALAGGLLDRDTMGPISHGVCPSCSEAMLALT